MDYRQYNAMTHMWVALIILIIVALIALAVIVMLYRAYSATAKHREKGRAVLRYTKDQDNAISGVIVEIEGNPATYSGFPAHLLTELERLHQVYPSVINGRTNREIY